MEGTKGGGADLALCHSTVRHRRLVLPKTRHGFQQTAEKPALRQAAQKGPDAGRRAMSGVPSKTGSRRTPGKPQMGRFQQPAKSRSRARSIRCTGRSKVCVRKHAYPPILRWTVFPTHRPEAPSTHLFHADPGDSCPLRNRRAIVRLAILHLKRGGDGNTATERTIHRAGFGVEPMDTLRELAVCGIEFQVVGDVDTANDEHLPVQFDLTGRVRGQPPLAGRDPARLQRAPKGAGESPGGRGHDVIQRGGVRRVDLGIHAVVFRDLRMDAEECRLILGRKIGAAQRTLHALNSNLGAVRYRVVHGVPLLFDRVRCTDSRQTVVILFAIRFWGRATVTSPAVLHTLGGSRPTAPYAVPGISPVKLFFDNGLAPQRALCHVFPDRGSIRRGGGGCQQQKRWIG